MLNVKPVRLLIKTPVPLPSVVWLSAVVGFGFVPQHTPRKITVAPPSDVTFPPLVAVVGHMFVTAVVVTVGSIGFSSVVNVTSFP